MDELFKRYLPKPKVSAKPSGIMVRPPPEVCEFIEALAHEHGCSANKVVMAFILAEYDKRNQAAREKEGKE